ncbi:MAG: hypothetical protein ACD_3C00145G0011 [uncultured bacterium (gcode 4)]|uniref:Single-stranded DNA-binding protein n=1 Tax=uncultured bacterium (gcode 4) TaxID=1234023 RepID=K2GWT5_9BACT|nr:MAG: hypothetical protein ACD_3C00145G0011 [uncultured bacterium (gcode 4)]
MSTLNKVQLIGNVVKDPDIKEISKGQHVANLQMATSKQWKDSDWNKKENVEYHSVVLWWKLSDIVEKFVSKGKKIYIEWYLQTRTWEDDKKQKKYKTEIVAEDIILLGVPDKSEKEIDVKDV